MDRTRMFHIVPPQKSLVKLIIMFFGVVVVIVALMFVTIRGVEQKYMKQWLIDSNLFAVDNIKNQIDDDIFEGEVDGLTQKVLQDVLETPKFAAFFSGDTESYDYSTDVFVQQYLSARSVASGDANNGLIRDIGVYSKSRNYVISLFNQFRPTQEQRLSIFGTEEIDTSYGSPFYWQSLSSGDPMIFSEESWGGDPGVYINFIRKITVPSLPGTEGGAVVVTMSEAALYREFNRIIASNLGEAVSKETRFMLLDRDGNILSAQDKSLIDQNIDIYGIELSDEVPNHLFGKVGGVNMLFTFRPSSRTSFLYFSCTPMASVTAVSDVVSRFLFLIAALTLGVGAALSFLFARHTVRPLLQLKKTCLRLLGGRTSDDRRTGGPEGDEYALIQSTLDRLDDRLRYHENVFVRAKPIINQHILDLLLSGRADADSIAQSFRIIGYELARPSFVVLAARAAYSGGGSGGRLRTEEVNEALLSVIEQSFWCSNGEMAFGRADGDILFIINCDDPEKNVAEIVRQLQDYAGDFPSLSLHVGVSETFARLPDAPEACRRARESLRYAFLYPESQVFFSGETAQWDCNDPTPLYRMADGLSEAVAGGDSAGYALLLQEFVQKILGGRFPVGAVLAALSQVRGALFAAARRCGVSLGADAAGESGLPEDVNSVSGYALYLEQAGGHLFSMVRHRTESRNRELAERAEAYIHARIAEEDISLAATAAALGVSPAHLSRLFKKTEGINFADFLIGEKLAYARSLLLTSDAKVQDIASKCGYANTQYFIGKFKKAYGTTPNEYRQRCSEEKLPDALAAR